MLQIIIFFIFAAILILIESYRENQIFKITEYKLEASSINSNLKILFLSDLHNHIYQKDNDRLLQAIEDEQPDLILIGGDMLIGKHSVKMDAALKLCIELPSIAPTYYALGNHERRMKENPDKYGTVIYDYIDKLKKAGIIFLVNRTKMLHFKNTSLCITGLDLPTASYERPHNKQIDKAYIQKLIGSSSKNNFQILLAHNPEHFNAYKSWGADLVLSGHLHGGVARIPGWRGVITPKCRLFPKYSGEMTIEENHTIIVSKGLGTHTIRFRLFNYPEIVVLKLCKAGEKYGDTSKVRSI